MSKKVVILVLAMVLSAGILMGQDSDVNKRFMLTAGAGGYGKFIINHTLRNFPSFDSGNFQTTTSLNYGPNVYLKADIFSLLSVEVAGNYLWSRGISQSGEGNVMRGSLSVFLQNPSPIGNLIIMYPFIGAGYEMLFYSKAKGATSASTRKNFNSLNDNLFLKLGGGLNLSLTDALRLNARLSYDIRLYNKNASNQTKSEKAQGRTSFYLQHAPTLFLGVGYAFLRI